ncbi:LLM class F420-dependent oxidoreductase [Actinotalea sp. M2MS4P-6]|uniref:LLM class F420-dependent oxidoreductase n=1 Tax=Actinotalea sp. M2MS4P-6 TaxID=2983762 RepID=UPI0021E42FE0|nr:LLM class F420-dependent oxidoreductase [Actinotalea sp. M2MS4P-6]MCV2395523.1 LLM class F420-dependent oxidoreductase [Actinotalea sp. M2MS4P-6]
MRFGLFIPQGWRMDLVGIDPAEQWQVMHGLAKHADDGDVFESVWVYDHFHTVPEPSEEATHEAWTLMAALAASTSRVRLGQMCTCMGYRNPAYLAKVAATVDLISGGRIEMGIGAGWYEHEWDAYGYGFPAVGDRLGMLDEGVQIMEQAWRTGYATLDGRYYQVDGARVFPQPLQEGGIPLWIAGGGEKRTLKYVARSAQYANIAGDPETFARKSEVLRGHCETLGRDFGSVVRSANYNVVIGATEAEVDDRIAAIQDRYARVLPDKAEQIAAEFRGGPLVGTPQQIVDKLRELEGLGMTYAITYFSEAAYDRSGIELFEREVAPALRG